MLIRIGYDIVLRLFNSSPVIFLLRIDPSLQANLVVSEDLRIDPDLPVDYYLDSFGNRCGRLNAPAGSIHFRNHAVVWDSGEPDPLVPEAEHEGVCHTPQSALSFLLPSRRRIGRIVIARGRDAADVPITMVFANHHLEKFCVITEEIEMKEENRAGIKRNSNLSQVPTV